MQSTRSDKFAVVLFGLYLVALHTSIAALEMTGWALALAGVVTIWTSGERPEFDRLTVGLLLLVGIVAVTGWPHVGYMRWVALLVLFRILLSRFVRSPKLVLMGSRIWLATLSIVSLYAVIQAFTGIDLVRPGRHATALGNMFYARGFFSLSITFASTVGMSSAFALAWALCGPKADRKWATVATCLGMVAVLFSLSRATLGALLVIVPMGILLTRPRWLIPTMLSLAVAGLVAATQFSSVQRRLSTLVDLGHDRSTGMRFNLWRAYWEIFSDHPWLGVGLFSPKSLVPEYYERLGISEPFVSHAHNNILQWLAGAGIFATLLYLTISVVLLVLSFRIFRRKSDPTLTALGLGSFLSQILFHIGGLVECNFFDAEVNHMIVFTWSLTLAIYGMDKISSRKIQPTKA